MAHGDTFKMIKLVGESSKGIEDAVQTALQKAGESLRGQSWAHIVDLRANLADDGSVEAWQVTVETGFKIESD
jgi:flavin-binding protein dodecin